MSLCECARLSAFVCAKWYMCVDDGCFVKTATMSIFSLLL